MFKIIEDINNYIFVDSKTSEVWGKFSKRGFSKKRVGEYLEKFNKEPNLYWKGLYLRELRDKKRDLVKNPNNSVLQKDIEELEFKIRKL